MTIKESLQRIFVAIKIYPNDGFNKKLTNIVELLKDEPIRWTRRENLHLTLCFIGECHASKISMISKQLSTVSAGTPAFELKVKGLGVFRSVSYPRVLWAGIESSSTLHALVENTVAELRSIGLNFNFGHYSPHLTLGRMKKILHRKDFENILSGFIDEEFLIQTAGSMVLYESIHGKEGALYNPLSEHYFRSDYRIS